jgi:hypothetical protein
VRFPPHTLPDAYRLVPLTFEAAETFLVAKIFAPLTFEDAQMFPELDKFAPEILPVATTFVLVIVEVTVTSVEVLNPWAKVTRPAKLEVPVP